MRGITKLSLLTFSAVVLSGCWLDDDDNDNSMAEPPEQASTYLRVHHTAADAPNVNVLADGSAVLEDVPYQMSSGVLELDAATYSVTVEGILPDESTVDVIGPTDLELQADMRYEVFAIGNVADESIEPLIVANEVSAVADGESRLQVVHGAYDAPAVDVYLTAPDDALADASPAATLAFSENTGQLDVTAGDYRVRLTPAGESTVVYDSGTLALADGGDVVVTATNNVSTGESPVTLQVATADGDTLLVPDAEAGADLRVVHASPDAPNVDVTLNNAAEPQIADLAYTEVAGYINTPADDYLVDVAAAGTDTLVVDDLPLTLETAMSYSVYAVGTVAADSLNLQVLTEQRRSIATAAQLQVVHASPSAGNVDIYLTETDDISAADPVVADVPFTADGLVTTGNLAVTPGEYVATVTPTGTTNAAIGPINLTLSAGGIYTIVAADADGGGTPLQVILLDDSVPAQP